MTKLFFFWKRDYSVSLTSVMGVFNKAQRKAQKLMQKMEQEIAANDAEIEALNSRNEQIRQVHKDTEKFANNLKSLIS